MGGIGRFSLHIVQIVFFGDIVARIRYDLGHLDAPVVLVGRERAGRHVGAFAKCAATVAIATQSQQTVVDVP